MTSSKEELAKEYLAADFSHRRWIADECEYVRKSFLAGFIAGESRYKEALEIFDNRRKLAYSLREESPQVMAFVGAIGVEIDKAMAGKLRQG